MVVVEVCFFMSDIQMSQDVFFTTNWISLEKGWTFSERRKKYIYIYSACIQQPEYVSLMSFQPMCHIAKLVSLETILRTLLKQWSLPVVLLLQNGDYKTFELVSKLWILHTIWQIHLHHNHIFHHNCIITPAVHLSIIIQNLHLIK